MSIAAVGAPRDDPRRRAVGGLGPGRQGDGGRPRQQGGRARLEYPDRQARLPDGAAGSATPGSRRPGTASPSCHHPTPGDDAGEVSLVDRSGQIRKLAGDFASLQGLAWSPSGEVWFTAASGGANRALYSVTRSGRVRLVARVTGTLDDPRLCARRARARSRTTGYGRASWARGPTDEKERDFGWLDFRVRPRPVGRRQLLLFDESGEGGGPGYSVYIRKTDGSPATRLGDGVGWAFSPDGRWALAVRGLGTRPEVGVVSDRAWASRGRCRRSGC